MHLDDATSVKLFVLLSHHTRTGQRIQQKMPIKRKILKINKLFYRFFFIFFKNSFPAISDIYVWMDVLLTKIVEFGMIQIHTNFKSVQWTTTKSPLGMDIGLAASLYRRPKQHCQQRELKVYNYYLINERYFSLKEYFRLNQIKFFLWSENQCCLLS